ncbi:response regulator [Spirosoma fluviale]|uniref:CheY chemotaxis protein or a CheY-like REC (Receiver) domain n=1 Tax=Spirosoma fluviale TaxID=1597977 RepID=A0A286F567_9BACT|nr:response regulator [Spirosoma fluviale]SOD78256.1 CheY chemotaxis protein or a CheY-like REC (receiver) domain [Spirosoma fluviale]
MVDILYVEDNLNDADIFCRLMGKLNRTVTYTVLHSGSEALDYLTGKGQHEQQRLGLPKLVLLDINLIGVSGIDVIEQTRSFERTRFLPIVVFSTSDNPKDIQSAYQAGINAYVVKPGSYQATGTLLRKLCDFWLENNTRIDYR